MNGTNLGVIDVPGTGGWYEWQNMVIPDVEVSSGEQFLKIQIVQEGFNIERITFESVNSSIDDSIILDQFMLGPPYPNPFNPNVNINLSVTKPGEYRVVIYSIKGENVREWNNRLLEEGDHILHWNGLDQDGRPVTSGGYFFKVINENRSRSRKMILLR